MRKVSSLRRTVGKRKTSRRSEKRRRAKVARTMGEFGRGMLHSGSKKGPVVRSRKQAIAIALSQARRGKR